MVALMRTAMRIACGPQYTDRQTNIQTDQQPTHPTRKSSPSVTRTRAQGGFIEGWGGQRFARPMGVTG